MENFIKYPKIMGIGHEENKDIFLNPEDEIVIEEKMDGANFRFMIHDGKIIFGSRTQQLTSDEGEDSNIDKNFRRCVNFIREKLKDIKLDTLNGLIFFGENMVKHTLDYDWEKIPPFLGYDIYSFETKRFMDFALAYGIYFDLGLPFVPVVRRTKASEIKEINEESVPISTYASPRLSNKQAEGIVFKNYNSQIFAKYVRNEFKEENAEVFGGRPKYNKEGDTDNSEFIFKFVTNARIEKHVFKLIDEGNNLDLKLMSLLPKRIYEDIWEENWKELSETNWKLDLKGLRRTIPKRCLAVLNQIITNNSLK